MGLQTFSLKGQIINIFNFASHVVSVTTELCHCKEKEAMDNTKTNGRGCVSIKLYLQKQTARQIRSKGHSFPTSGVGDYADSVQCLD